MLTLPRAPHVRHHLLKLGGKIFDSAHHSSATLRFSLECSFCMIGCCEIVGISGNPKSFVDIQTQRLLVYSYSSWTSWPVHPSLSHRQHWNNYTPSLSLVSLHCSSCVSSGGMPLAQWSVIMLPGQTSATVKPPARARRGPQREPTRAKLTRCIEP